jgi:hypothetical protein
MFADLFKAIQNRTITLNVVCLPVQDTDSRMESALNTSRK